VRRAVELLIATLDRENRERHGELLALAPDEEVYRGAVTVMMRLVFLFVAEERRLLPVDDPLYAETLAATTIRAQLQERADRDGEDILEKSTAAWHRILALFRAVHGGIEHDALRLPAYPSTTAPCCTCSTPYRASTRAAATARACCCPSPRWTSSRSATSTRACSTTPRSALRPPDLVIQDELHLISGPLGSLVGLYETAVDALATWEVDGTAVRPKVIASTATIRRAGDQVARLFARGLKVFPPPGLDARDSFFALQRDRPQEQDDRPGRRYLGICAPGRRYKQVLIRAYLAQLSAAWTVLGRQPGPEADAYMTLVGYFNSLRELGGMRRLVEDDVQNRLFRADERGQGRGRLILEELTSRKSASEIPATLDQLGVERLNQDKRGGGGRPPKGARYEPPSIDVLLATNMISVGVDVQRLGAMVVAGQPKSTSEYIQATSRVGRRFPGLVMTVYNWARPRDLSHYETFGHYHATLYRQVEALSVTPFAPRALDRGLTGVLASLLRLGDPAYNDNPGAGRVDPADALAVAARAAIRDRAGGQIGPGAAGALDERIATLLDAWRAEAQVGQRTLVYQRRGKSDADVSLLQEPGIEGWSRWTVPTSMRNVETAVPLALRPRGVAPAGEDWEAPQRSAPLPKEPS
jgi:hypothetical protein